MVQTKTRIQEVLIVLMTIWTVKSQLSIIVKLQCIIHFHNGTSWGSKRSWYNIFSSIERHACSQHNQMLIQLLRILGKPISVQDSSREQHFKDRYRFLEEDYKNCTEDEREIKTPPFHYGSHYSNRLLLIWFSLISYQNTQHSCTCSSGFLNYWNKL